MNFRGIKSVNTLGSKWEFQNKIEYSLFSQLTGAALGRLIFMESLPGRIQGEGAGGPRFQDYLHKEGKNVTCEHESAHCLSTVPEHLYLK